MKFIDFFAGIGGFRLGMEMAGHISVGHCEIDKFAEKSYRAMHDVKEWEWYANDIRRVRPDELPESDCWCGGFPCQAFSIAGKRRGFEDMRGTLIFEIFRLASERKPKILFLENVSGLLNHDGGRTFGTILYGLWELGYDVQWQVLNSKNFGVPQNRERVFIIGHLGRICRQQIFPIFGTNGKDIKEFISGGQRFRCYDPNGCSPCLNTCPGGGTETKIIQRLINKNNNSIKFREDFNCIDANYGKGIDSKQARTGVLEEKRIRKLTPKECFRLQGFPDELFEKAKTVNSDTQLYKQAGNSVTVNVIHEIAKRLS